MNPDNGQTKDDGRYFPLQGHFTACMAGIMLLRTDVDFFKNSGFAPGFFEGKPRGKNKQKTPQ
jgi:hypothetical protein